MRPHVRPRSRTGWAIMLAAGLAVTITCAGPPAMAPPPATPPSAARPGGGSPAAREPQRAPAPTSPMPEAPPPDSRDQPEATAAGEPAPPPALVVPPSAPAGAGEPVPTHRLPWVNPSRCLASCAFDPGPELRRLDDQGAPSARGKHRVDAAAAAALAELLAAAHTAGHKIRITSAYRSYQDQTRVFRTMKERGRAARPGHSEHQLGTAIDLRLPTGASIAWLGEHAAEHGFALSYPEGKQRLTGYRPEPWHVRFVGRDVAGELRRRGWILEELFRSRPELGESGTCQDCPAPVSRKACGAVTRAGVCQGTVLTWCYDGALAAVDCAVSGQTCGPAEGDRPPDCR